MSIKSLYPEIQPSLNLDFARVKALDPRIDFTRSSSATYYDGVTTAKAEENLLLQSEFASGWSLVGGGSLTVNNTTAPDGTTTGASFVASNTNTQQFVARGLTWPPNQFTISVFAKANGYGWVQIYTTLTFDIANFDLTNGVLGTVSATASATIADVGNGWYRCTLTITSPSTSTQSVRFGVYDSDAARGADFQGNGTDGIYLWGAQLEQRSAVTAYTPTTDQPITNYIPVLQTAANNVARFDHNPVTGESLGLLVEEQRTNLVTYSEQFDNGVWNKTNSSIISNTIVAPDGTLTGDKFIASSGLFGVVEQPQAGSGLTRYTFSIYLKKGKLTSAVVMLRGASFSNRAQVNVDLNSGSLSGLADVGTFTSPISNITSIGNGWYRVSLTATTGSGETSIRGRFQSFNTGDGSTGFYAWGAQLEAGAFSTSYIKTEASQVTRVRDSAEINGSNFSSWYRADEGTALVKFQTTGRTIGMDAMKFDSTLSTDDVRFIIANGGGSGPYVYIYNKGALQAQGPATTATTANTDYTLSYTYAVNDFFFYSSLSGGITSSDTNGVLSNNINLLRFDSHGYLKRVMFYPKRITNDHLINISKD